MRRAHASSDLEPTERQLQVLAFVRDFSEDHQRPPTRAEIAAHFGWRSANAAEEHLQALDRKGLIRLIGRSARGIEVVSA